MYRGGGEWTRGTIIGTSEVGGGGGRGVYGTSQRLAARDPHRGAALRGDHRLHLRVDLLRRVTRHHR